MDDGVHPAERTRAGRTTLLTAGAVLGTLVAAGVGVASLAGGLVEAIAASSIEPAVVLAGFGSPFAGAALPALLLLRSLELGLLVVGGLALAGAGCFLAWCLLWGRADEARSIVRDGLVLTVVGVLVIGSASTVLAWPSRMLDGDALTPHALALAAAVGLLGAPIGAAMLVVADAIERHRAAGRAQIEVVHVDFGGSTPDDAAQPR